MTLIPDAAVGAIVAATIAALASLLGLIISKENKTSEFRLAWVDALRAEIACVIAHAAVLQQSMALGLSQAKLWTDVRNDYVRLSQSTVSVRLRLNPIEERSKAVLESLDRLELAFKAKPFKHGALVEIENKLIADAQTLLKAEWIRVRNGEIAFQTARAVSFTVVLLGFAALLYWVARNAF